MSEQLSRPWETQTIDARFASAERIAAPMMEPVAAGDVVIDANSVGFTVTNQSPTDHSVLITLMARARAEDAENARTRLFTLTSAASHAGVLRVADVLDDSAYARLWLDDVEAHDHQRGGTTATRSGAVVVPMPSGASFQLTHDPAALREGVVVAAVAAVGDGLDGALLPVDRGAAASIGERPDPPA